MKVTVDKKELQKAVNLALLASGRAAKDVALANVLVRVDGAQQRASIESYDTHVYSKASLPAVGDSGEFAVEGARLDHLIGTADEGSITFDVHDDGLTATFGRASINLRTFPIEKYVRFTTSGEQVRGEGIRSGLLGDALEFIRPFIGRDTQKPQQMLAELRNNRFMAGDGVRIGVATLDSLPFGLKIPQAVVSNVSRWLRDGTAFTNADGEAVEGLVDVLETEDFYILRTASKLNYFAWRKPEHDFMRVEPYLDEMEREVPEAVMFRVDQVSLQRMVDSLSVVLEAGAEQVAFDIEAGDGQAMLLGTARDSRGVASENRVQVMADKANGNNAFMLRYSHLLDTLKLLTNPVISCNVRQDKHILRISETHPEMKKTALLTLMTE